MPGWNLDPVTKKFISKAEAIARGLRPPEVTASTPPAPPPPPSAGAGSGNVIPFGRTVTLGDALEAIDLKRAGPPDPEPQEPDAEDDDDDLEVPPPAETPDPPEPPAAPTSRDDDPDSFAKLAGKVGTQLGIGILGSIHRRRGVEPNQLDDDDVEHLEEETAKAIRRGIGDGPVPWWAPVVSAWGLAYFAMGNGAPRLERPAPDQLVAEPPPASSPPPAPTFTAAPPAGPIRPPNAKPAPIQITPTRAA